MFPTLRPLLLWRGGKQRVWTRHCGVPLQGLPLRGGQNLRHQCWSHAVSGKCQRFSNTQESSAPHFHLHCSLIDCVASSAFSGSTRWAPVWAFRWATICGSHATCCTACAKTSGLSPRWTPNRWRATGTAPGATRTSAPRRWGKKGDWSE